MTRRPPLFPRVPNFAMEYWTPAYPVMSNTVPALQRTHARIFHNVNACDSHVRLRVRDLLPPNDGSLQLDWRPAHSSPAFAALEEIHAFFRGVPE